MVAITLAVLVAITRLVAARPRGYTGKARKKMDAFTFPGRGLFLAVSVAITTDQTLDYYAGLFLRLQEPRNCFLFSSLSLS